MSEEQQAQESQEETEGQVQETAEETNDTEVESGEEAGGQESESNNEELDAATLRTNLTSANQEAANYRIQRNQARERVQELEGARGEADEQVQSENASLREQNETLLNQVRRSAFIEAINLPSPRLAWASLADAGVEVEYDENNRPKNLADVRKALKREFPREFGDGSVDGGSGNGSPQSADMNTMLRSAAGR